MKITCRWCGKIIDCHDDQFCDNNCKTKYYNMLESRLDENSVSISRLTERIDDLSCQLCLKS